MSTTSKREILIALALMFTGSLIYLTCRQDLLIFNILDKIGFLEKIKIDIQYNGNIFIYFFLFCLPDMLWYSALLLIQKQFYRNDMVISKILFYIALSLPFVMELMQYFKWISGTFDVVDICSYLSILIFLKYEKKI